MESAVHVQETLTARLRRGNKTLLREEVARLSLDGLTLKDYRTLYQMSEVNEDARPLFSALTERLLASNDPRHKALVSYPFINQTLRELAIDPKLKSRILKHWRRAEVAEVLGLLVMLNIIDDPRFETKLAQSPSSQTPVVREFLLEQYFKGGLFAIEDGGELYRQLIMPTRSADRSYDCSHPSTHPVHSYQGKFIPEFLYGTRDIHEHTNDKNETIQIYTPSSTKSLHKGTGHYSWWQTEYASLKGSNWVDSVIQWVKHKISFLIYKITKKNVGPFGQSAYMEKNILLFTKKSAPDRREAEVPTDYFNPRLIG